MNRRLITILLLLAFVASVSVAGDLFQDAMDHFRRGNYEAAVKGYLKFAEANAKDERAPVALFNAASINMVEVEDLPAAKGGFLELVSKYPDTKWAAEGYRRLAEISLALNDLPQALDYYRLGLKHAAGNGYEMPEVWISEMVQACQMHLAEMDDPAKTIEVYRDITGYIPSGEGAAQARYNLAQVLKTVGRREEAANTLAELMYAYPYSRWSAQAMRDDREMVDEFLDFPWDDLEKMAQVEPMFRRMQYSEARDILDEIAVKYAGNSLGENAEYGLINADLYLTGDFIAALEEMRDYLDKYPKGVRATSAERRIELYEDIVRMEDRLEYDPQDYSTHIELGFNLLRNRFMPLAEQHFLKATEDTTSDIAYMGLGYVYVNTGRSMEGIESFERYLQNHPDDGNLYNRIGYAYMGMGEMDEALKCFEKYRELEPENPNSHDSYAECLMNMGKLEESIAEYLKAIEINPNFTNPYFMLGEVYSRMDNTERALEYYRMYLERDPAGFQSAQALARIDSLSSR